MTYPFVPGLILIIGVMEYQKNGVLECWSNGVMVKKEQRHWFDGFAVLQYSNTPLLHGCNTPILHYFI
jgi:hypothetical protein